MIGLTSTPAAPELHRQAQRSAGFMRKLTTSSRTCDRTCVTALKITSTSSTGILKQQRHTRGSHVSHCPQKWPRKSDRQLQRTDTDCGRGPLGSAPQVGAEDLTHPNVPKAALSQLPLQQEGFPGHFPSIPPKAHGEGGGVGTGLGQVIAQSVIAAC